MINRLRKWMKRDDGFTLIELMVVIVILGILAGIGIPTYNNFVDRAYRAELEVAKRTLLLGLELYKMDEGDYPDDALINEYTGENAWFEEVKSGETLDGVNVTTEGKQWISDWPEKAKVEDYSLGSGGEIGDFTITYVGKSNVSVKY